MQGPSVMIQMMFVAPGALDHGRMESGNPYKKIKERKEIST